MRILSVAEKWEKLHLELPLEDRPQFSTFRFSRADAPKGRDWHQGETVQIVYRSRTPTREVLGNGLIVTVTSKLIGEIGHFEAIRDGFPRGRVQMFEWLARAHHINVTHVKLKPINKLTIRWAEGL